MAGRPLSNVPKPRGSSWVASVPESPGSKKRATRSFPTQDSAQAWLDTAHAALRDNRPIPDAEPFRRAARRQRPVQSKDFADVARAWFKQSYAGRSPDRIEDVGRQLELHIIPFFSSRVASIDDLHQEDLGLLSVRLTS